MKALKPATPRSCCSASLSTFPSTSPPRVRSRRRRSLDGRQLLVEGRPVDGDRHVVQRHVHVRRVPARGEGPGAACDSSHSVRPGSSKWTADRRRREARGGRPPRASPHRRRAQARSPRRSRRGCRCPPVRSSRPDHLARERRDRTQAPPTSSARSRRNDSVASIANDTSSSRTDSSG